MLNCKVLWLAENVLLYTSLATENYLRFTVGVPPTSVFINIKPAVIF